MKLIDILEKEQIFPDLQAQDKLGILRKLAEHICQKAEHIPLPHEEIAKALFERECLGSTGVGEGVAIPHAKIPGLTKLIASFARIRQGVPFDAIDQKPVELIFVLLVPENSAGVHLKALARISRLLKNDSFRQTLLKINDQDVFYRAFIEQDEKY